MTWRSFAPYWQSPRSSNKHAKESSLGLSFRFAVQDCYVVGDEIVLDVEHLVGGEWRPIFIFSVKEAEERIFTLPI